MTRGADDDDDNDDDRRRFACISVKMSFAWPPRDSKLSPLHHQVHIAPEYPPGVNCDPTVSRDVGSVRQPLPTQDMNVVSVFATVHDAHVRRGIECNAGSTEV